MKSLRNYVEDEQTKLFDKYGVFFAFSDKQFEEGKKEGVQYASIGMGTICPKENVNSFVNDLHELTKKGIKQDLEENGKDKIIMRELESQECFYTGDWSDCLEYLKGYGIGLKEIEVVYNREKDNHED